MVRIRTVFPVDYLSKIANYQISDRHVKMSVCFFITLHMTKSPVEPVKNKNALGEKYFYISLF